MLTAKNVSYWYDTAENTLYKDVNLDFEAGKLYGIIGSSGAGKTTLLTMLSGLDKPRRGSILYEGTDIQKNRLNPIPQSLCVHRVPSLQLTPLHVGTRQRLDCDGHYSFDA